MNKFGFFFLAGQSIFKNENDAAVKIKEEKKGVSSNSLVAKELNENENEKDFTEKTKRKMNNASSVSNRKHDNHGERSSFNNRNSNSGTSSFRKQSDNPNVSRASINGGDNKPFGDRLRDEEVALREKYATPKEKLCYKFVKGDLFSAPSDASLAHCVSEDFRMGKGIATEFKKRFDGVNELLSQSKLFNKNITNINFLVV